MEGWSLYRQRLWSAVAASGFLLLTSQSLNAELLQNTVSEKGDGAPALQVAYVPRGTSQPVTPADSWQAWQDALQRLHRDWHEIQDAIVRETLEMVLTMNFGWYTPPPPPPSGSGDTPPPDTGGTPPPPPTGSGDPPPSDPGSEPPPPGEAPEPSTLLSGLVGAGIAGWVAWRRRRKSTLS